MSKKLRHSVFWALALVGSLSVAMLPAIAGGVLGTSKDADIIRQAVSHLLGKKPDEIIDEVYQKVQKLDLSKSEILDLQPIKIFTGLQLLILNDTEVSNIEPLKALNEQKH